MANDHERSDQDGSGTGSHGSASDSPLQASRDNGGQTPQYGGSQANPGEQQSLYGYQTQPGGYRVGNDVQQNQPSANGPQYGQSPMQAGSENQPAYGAQYGAGQSQPGAYDQSQPGAYDQGQQGGYQSQPGAYDQGQQGGYQPQQGAYDQSYGGYQGQPGSQYGAQGQSAQYSGYQGSLGGQYSGYDPSQGGYASVRPYKSKTTAALLAFFLGGIGVHSFYLGKKTIGLAHVGVVALSLLLMIGGGIAGDASADPNSPLFALIAVGYFMIIGNNIWAFVEFVMILTKPEHELGR